MHWAPTTYDLTVQSPLAAAEEYRRKACEHNNTARLCSAQNITYEPIVFTVQGGVECRAETILCQLAEVVAELEGKDMAATKAELFERISLTLTRHAADAVLRRQPRPGPSGGSRSGLGRWAMEREACETENPPMVQAWQ